jgi:hypothetical protein
LPLAFQGQHEFHHVVDARLHTGRDRQIRAVLTALLNGLYQALTTRKREPYANSQQRLTKLGPPLVYHLVFKANMNFIMLLMLIRIPAVTVKSERF